MSGGLPTQIDPLELAKNQAQVTGQYDLAEMPRLSTFRPQDSAKVDLHLRFTLEADRLVRMTGKVATVLQLTCERCLQPMELKLELAPDIYFEGSGKPVDELDERDIVSLGRDSPIIDLLGLVEDEILLALPMMPMHTSDKCRPHEFHQQQEDTEQRGDNPFAKLAVLKKKGD